MIVSRMTDMGMILIMDEDTGNMVVWSPASKLLSVKYNGGCTYTMPKAEYDKRWLVTMDSVTDKDLSEKCSLLVKEVIAKDPFKDLKISFK